MDIQIKVVDPGADLYGEAAALVSGRYAVSFGADVMPTPDQFVVCAVDGEVVACAGLSRGEDRRFFFERYLTGDAELTIGGSEGLVLARREVVEISGLASKGGRTGAELISVLRMLAWCLGFRSLLITTTASLRKTLQSLGIEFCPLAPATPATLDEQARRQWGSYYDNEPVCGYVPIERVAPVMARSIGRWIFESINITVTPPVSEAAGVH